MFLVIVGVVLFIIAFLLGALISAKIGKNKISKAKEASAEIIADAEKEAKSIKREKLLEVKDEWLKKKQDFDNEVNTRRQKLQAYEKKIESRELNLEKKYELVIEKEKNNKEAESQLTRRKEVLERKLEEAEKLIIEQNIRLEKTAGLTKEEARS
jgi:ribonuclease Y